MLKSNDKELIILTSPPDGDNYYAGMADAIFEFHINYAKAIMEHDDVIVLTGDDRYDDYVDQLGTNHVSRIPQADIWARDFTLSYPTSPIMFHYTAAGQGGSQDEADYVKETFYELAKRAKLSFETSELRNDGGNLVDDYAGRAILSRKFLRDNELSEPEGRNAIKHATGAEHVAFIEADEQGGLEHADGVVAFIDDNRVVINSYPEDPEYAGQLKSTLRSAIPNIIIHEITTPYDGSSIYDDRFGSACGLYTNMLVTPHHIYLPQFGIPQDKIALANMRKWTSKKIIPIQSQPICQMGGGVRCMSLQLRGANAKTLANYLRVL